MPATPPSSGVWQTAQPICWNKVLPRSTSPCSLRIRRLDFGGSGQGVNERHQGPKLFLVQVRRLTLRTLP